MLTAGCVTVTEAILRGQDEHCGAQIKQMTSAPAVHTNIYGEVPYTDPSSRWFIYTRGRDSFGPVEFWRADLHTNWLTPICEGGLHIYAGTAISCDQRYFYCLGEEGQYLKILQTEIETLAQQSFNIPREPHGIRSLGSLTPDGRVYLYGTRLGSRQYGIVVIDLNTGKREVIHEDPEICNAHPQIEPGKGEEVLIQHNRGCEFDDEGRCLRLVGEEGATLYLIDVKGGNFRQLPVGKPCTDPVQGHQCWIGTTGEILLTTAGNSAQQMIEEGNLLAVRPGDAAARVVARGYVFCHPSASRDGRFFVSDTQSQARLVVGSLRTGRTRVLCETGASFSSPQYTHPHPYFTPDCQWVIFNSDRTGVPHVWAARLPEGMLEELEA